MLKIQGIYKLGLAIIMLFFICCKENKKTDSEFITLFNGKNLDGWVKHGTEKWYVTDGELICESGPDAQYGYLTTTDFYDDFELSVDFKQEKNGNSGIFFRSTVDGTKVSGWQVEVAPPMHNSGGIYESYGRGWLVKPDPEKDKALKMGEWNTMKIVAIGSSITTWLNGTEMIQIEDEKIGQGKGAIALQIHDGGGIKVHWKNLKIKPIKKEVAEAEANKWIPLFNGTSTEGWRAYNGKELPPQWVIEDGVLSFDTDKKLETDFEGGKDIIYAAEEFNNFDLYLEWKIPEGGNSGVMYHIKEGEYSPYEVAPEYQLLDDLKWEEINNTKLEEWQKTGADYAMYTPNSSMKVVKPAGEWNTTRIKFTTERVEHWLNGKMILSFVPWSEDWKQRKTNGKWKDFSNYGKYRSGYIGLQDHDSPLWFRNIKIKKL